MPLPAELQQSITTFSIGESKAAQLVRSSVTGLVGLNRRQITRVYPKGTRADSSNYDPFPFWGVGSQMVALNYQTPSMPMFANLGKFKENGGCGYLLKPEYMRKKFEPAAPTPLDVRLRIICGHMLPSEQDDILDGYVVVSVLGPTLALASAAGKARETGTGSMPGDESVKSIRTIAELVKAMKPRDKQRSSTAGLWSQTSVRRNQKSARQVGAH